MIELTGLSKRYGSVVAVDDLNLRVAGGEIFGFLGPNGAGKTTTIKMMMGLLRPSVGRIQLGGYDLATDPLAAKALCGFVPDRPHLYDKLSGRETMDFVAGLYRVPAELAERRRGRLLSLFDLDAWQDEMVESYSHGMKQRLVMAAAMIHAPRVLIVDEPMVGMDPRGARLLKETFRELARGGVTIFLSTHSLEVAQETCDRVGIIHSGRLRALGSLAALRREAAVADDASLETIFLRLTDAAEIAASPMDIYA